LKVNKFFEKIYNALPAAYERFHILQTAKAAAQMIFVRRCVHGFFQKIAFKTQRLRGVAKGRDSPL
ncbi:MAG: hypothetical protein IKA95_04390, partial [Clostridia bacterium]|nr:hypothetical protein [Clostridia bacterium]